VKQTMKLAKTNGISWTERVTGITLRMRQVESGIGEDEPFHAPGEGTVHPEEKTIERRFANAKEFQGMRNPRYRGPKKVQVQFRLTAKAEPSLPFLPDFLLP